MRSLFLLGSISIILAACGSNGGGGRYGEYDPTEREEEICSLELIRITELEEQLEEARAQLASLEDRRDQLQSAAEDLRNNVDRLSSENWRDVVPDIDASSEGVESESSQMSDEIDAASSTLDER